MTDYYKLKSIILGQHAIALFGLIYLFSWQGILLSFIAWQFYYSYGMILGFHRVFAHKTYTVSDFSKISMLIFGSLAGMGSSIGWIGQHRSHHVHADNPELDPYYSKFTFIEKFKAWFTYPAITKFKISLIKDIIKDKSHVFFHTHYYKILAVWVVFLSMFGVEAVVYLWALPNVFTYTALTLVGTLGHNVGNQPVSKTEEGRDCHWLNLFTLGESYQNSHHVVPAAKIQGRFDFIGYMSKPFFKE